MKKRKYLEERFFSTDNKFKGFHGVFEQYSALTDRFIRVFYDQYEYTDAPYWNIERSNIGMLSAACWANGWITLEEFSTGKTKEDATEGTGRCDLWVSSQDGSDNFAIEAKKGDCSLASNDISGRLNNILQNACSDAEKLDEEGDIHLGVAFMHLYLVKSKLDQVNDLVKNAVSEIETFSKDVNFAYIYI